MKTIKKTFTYKTPNIIYSQDDSENKTGTLTYEGPEWLFIYVDEKTGYLRQDLGAFATNLSVEEEEYARSREEEGTTAILINAADETEVAYIIADMEPKHGEIREKRIFLKEGDREPLYTLDDPIEPKKAYNVDEIRYSFATKSFVKPLPYAHPKAEKQQWLDQITLALELAQEDIDNNELSEDKIKLYNDYIEDLKSWEETTKDHPYYLVPMPDHPDFREEKAKQDPNVILPLVEGEDEAPKPSDYIEMIDPEDLDDPGYFSEEDHAKILKLYKAWSGSDADFITHVASEMGYTQIQSEFRCDFIFNKIEEFWTYLEEKYSV